MADMFHTNEKGTKPEIVGERKKTKEDPFFIFRPSPCLCNAAEILASATSAAV